MAVPSLGPYRIQDRLGAGGMGEVFRAFDERLERSVAIKWIRLEERGDQQARLRFIREARAVAGLNHPAIVQIHDILEQEERTAIVMELVAGQTLTQVLANGPLPPASAVQIGQEIAEGLAEAHGKGIVHRDLKTDNVMVTPTGHVKILDFGLARRLSSEHPESTLTGKGQLLGTCHAMSPEQAQGFEVDHRSDLFSFGTLLYETVTGQSPFRRDSALETLSRIFTWHQPPAQEVNPQVPDELSDIIDQLLEKDPNLRPSSAGAVAQTLSRLSLSATPSTSWPAGNSAATALQAPTLVKAEKESARRAPTSHLAKGFAALLVLTLLTAGFFFLRPEHGAPLYVAVLEPEMVGGTSHELVAFGIRVALLRTLVDLEGVFPYSTEQVDAVPGSPLEVARRLAADEVLTSRLSCSGLSCNLALSRIDGTKGRVLWIRDVTVSTEDLKLLNHTVTHHLRAGYGDRTTRPGAPDLEVREEDYARYLTLNRDFVERQDDTPLDLLVEGLHSIQQTSPRFLDAFLLEARIRHQRYTLSHDRTDFDHALQAIAQARRLTPNDPQPLFHLFVLHLTAQNLDQAEEVLEDLDQMQPGDATVLANRALLENERGRFAEARALMKTAVARHPSWANLFNLSTITYKQGDLNSTRKYLQQALERSPENYRTLSFLAEVETLAGKPEAVTLYEDLVQRSAGVREVWNLGSAYLLMGRYDEAAERFRQALELEPRAWRITMSLADAELLRGQQEVAQELFRDVLEKSQGEDAPSGMTLLIRAQAFAALGHRQQAAATLQEALKMDSNRPHFAYQASLIYTLIEEPFSALASAEKALKLGMGPRWFQLPWFDSLRSHPDFPATAQ